MQKEYGIIFYKSSSFWVAVAFSLLAIFCLYIGIVKSWWWFIVVMFILIGPWILLGYFYFPKLKIILDDDKIIIKMPDRTTQIMIKDIYRIDKELGWGSYSFCIHYIENGKRRIAGFSDEVQGYQEILSYIERKRPKNHPASKESRIKKILRIIFLIIMYSVMFGVTIFTLFAKK